MRIFILIFVLIALLATGFVTTSTYLYRTPVASSAKTVIIPPRTSGRAILRLLHAEGLTPSAPLMLLPVYISGANRSLKAGEYLIEAGMTPAQIIHKIVRGEVVVHKLTVPEGWTSYQVRQLLEAEPLLTGALPAVIAEGSLFPDTVHFTRGESRAGVLARMQEKRAALLAELWAGHSDGLPFSTPEEALVFASIVEKETGLAEERGQVAGVFLNRLKIGMPLQSDPTVAYGVMLASGGKPLERSLTTADLKKDSPYNTYTRAGLPPTPICNPGRDALYAALHPSATNALYFVATGHGGHYFATTLKEHNANVMRYRRTRR